MDHPDGAKSVPCPYCGASAPLVSGLEVYPHRRDLWPKKFYLCKPCNAWVGCHPPASAKGGGQGDGTVPMGRLANTELRAAKQAAHAAFDPIWKAGRMRRRDAYAWLAKKLRIHASDCHIGEFDESQCRRVVAVCMELQQKEANDEKKKASAGKPLRPAA